MNMTSFGRLARSAALSAALCAAGADPVLAQADPLANCRYYTKTQADFQQGLPHCRAAIEKYPEDPEARFYGAWCLAETGNWDEAWKSFSWLIERKESSDKKIRKHADMAEKQALFYYQTHYNRGLELVDAEKFEEADAAFAIATKIYPSKIEAYLNRGFAQTQRKDLDGALASFEAAVAMNPKHLQAQLYYWDALNQKLKQLRGAETRDTAAIDETSEKLAATLMAVLELPDVKTEDRAAAYMQLADLAFAKGENQKAIEYVTKATEIAPEKITELYNMGIEFYNANDYGPAIQALRTVMTQVDDESDELWRKSLYVVGLSSLYTADYAGCIAAMDKLIALDPGNMDYYLNRGKAHAKAGNENEAAADITKYEKMKEAAATGSSK